MSAGEEKKHQRLGFLSSIGIHVVMGLLFIFVMGWTAPNPPLGEAGSGIELNFGLNDQGGGDIQPETPPGNPEAAVTESTEKTVTEQPPQEEVKPQEQIDEKPLASEEDSPVTTKESKKVSKTVIKKEVVVKPKESKPSEKVVEKKVEQKTVAVTDTKKVTEEKKGTPGPSQGDDKGKSGDKGNPQGTLDAKALYGKPGSGGPGEGGPGGSGITVDGFVGFERPAIVKPEIPNESYGTYQFAVKVNKEGEVISIRPITKGISLEAERIFKRTIENTEFVAKISNLPAESEGIITFKVVPPPTRKNP